MWTEKLLLDKLLHYFFINSSGELLWGILEDTPIQDLDEDLAKALIAYIRGNRKNGIDMDDYQELELTQVPALRAF
jgi:hypothetical protein